MDKLTPALSPTSIMPLPPMSVDAVAAVRRLEGESLQLPQVDIHTEHALHAGMYARTVVIPAGVVLTGAEIKIPTLLIINGDTLVYGDDGPLRFTGYHVCMGETGRKQAFYAITDTNLTMIFPTGAKTVEDAEMEFTDEYEKLVSRKGEQCQV